ncbi:MAG: hypothetical protein VKJ09_14935 [Leptolyngbya sp.]|nr:hypothetical protein [Leptolyngbya sp.]
MTHITVEQRWQRVYRIACSVEQINALVSSLVEACLPKTFYAILNFYWSSDQVETYLSAFLPRAHVEAAIAPHLPLLVHDGMVGYGFAWYDTLYHEEIYIDDHKEVIVMTSKPKAAESILRQYGLAYMDELNFASEQPHGHFNLGGPWGTGESYLEQIIHSLAMERMPIPENV